MERDPTPDVLARQQTLRQRFGSPRLRDRRGEGLRGRRRRGEDRGDVRAVPGRRHGPAELDAGGARPRRGRLRQGRLAGDAARDRRPRDRHGPHRVRARCARERHERAAPPGRARRGAAHGRPPALPRAAASIASTQAMFPYPNQNHLGVYVPTLGAERARRALAFKAIDDAGAVQAFGSDWPVFTAEVGARHRLRRDAHDGRGHAAGRLGALAAAHRRGGAAPLHARRGLRRARRDRAGDARQGARSPTSSCSRRTFSRSRRSGSTTTKVLLTVLGGQDTLPRAKDF